MAKIGTRRTIFFFIFISKLLVAAGVHHGRVSAVGKDLGHDAGLGAHGGAGHVADLAVGAAVVALGEAEAARGGGSRRHEESDEEESNHNRLGVRHCCCARGLSLVGWVRWKVSVERE
ncbi:hypothetical protein B296_00047282 [Ensete ventricosum]|uniref:Uncharacterized protein n=1 Tax=Ensete ventricosum TaxID=4639 RepID=A0A426Z087_ENSVE|nr:hypothetical protein B296_00047282 [Ensete ventricosum]